VHVIHYGAEPPASRIATTAARAQARQALGLPADALVVGSVGNFTAKKDHRTLLEATARAASQHGGLRLVLVGSGPLERELRDTTRSLGLTARVAFAGSRDDVAELLPAFDVFALSSRNEGLPISLLEAMAAGVPCVATSVGGVPEVVTDREEGLLVPPEDAVGLAEALCRLLGTPKMRKAAGARAARTARRFDITQAVGRTEDVYRQALRASLPEPASQRR
jgi:glycosyltransferase involved in cell wall biosynthesis